MFKTGSNEYVSLAGHVSKSCEKVWKSSRSLRYVVEVTKHSRSEFWPMNWVTGPTDDNIDIYFFPYNMRPDEDVEQLVNEVMENDMVLRSVVGKAEMLIFPSMVLPEQYQTFQSKHYLWGLFKPIEGVVEEQQPHATSTMEHAMHSENQEDFQDGTEQVEANPVPGPTMDTELEDPEESKKQEVDQDLAPSLAIPSASHLNQQTVEATATPTLVATSSANHGQVQSSLGIPPDRMFAFVGNKTPRIEQLIQELEREGALVFSMQRVMALPPLGQAAATE